MNRLKEIRKTQGWSILELSATTGVSTARIVQIERYNAYPGPSVRGRLAAALGVAERQLWPEGVPDASR